MTNDTERAARYGGFYKTIQNAAGAIANQLEAQKVPYMTQLIVTFALNAVGLALALFVSIKVPDVTVETIDNLQDGIAEITLVGGQAEEDEKLRRIGSGHLNDERLSDRADTKSVDNVV